MNKNLILTSVECREVNTRVKIQRDYTIEKNSMKFTKAEREIERKQMTKIKNESELGLV